jgi:hypothetical protein
MIPYEIKSAILKRDATAAVVSFSGGNDEGGPDRMRLVKPDPEDPTRTVVVEELEMWDDETGDYSDDPLIRYLEGIVNGRFGFNGPGHVSGRATVDAIKGETGWEVNEEVPTFNSWTE